MELISDCKGKGWQSYDLFAHSDIFISMMHMYELKG